MHPPAPTGRVDPPNPGVKADQRTGRRARFHHILSAFEKNYLLIFFGGGGDSEFKRVTQIFKSFPVFRIISEDLRIIFEKTPQAAPFVFGHEKKEMDY